jgi:hypothetical protein
MATRKKNEQRIKDVRRQIGAAGPGPCRVPAAARFFFSDFSVSVFVDFCFFAHTLVPVLFRDFRDFFSFKTCRR